MPPRSAVLPQPEESLGGHAYRHVRVRCAGACWRGRVRTGRFSSGYDDAGTVDRIAFVVILSGARRAWSERPGSALPG
jgi:hypothetical protein